MAILPIMRDYFELTEAGRGRRLRRLAEIALAEYDLEVVRIRLLAQDSNAVFRVDTASGRPWVIRVGIGGPVGHSAAEVRSEMAWLEALALQTDIEVPAPLRARSGELLVTVEADGVPEPRNCVVFSWLRGPLLADRLDRDNLHAFGAYSARLHRHGATFEPTAGFAAPTYDRVFPFDEPEVLFTEEHGDLLTPERRRVFQAAARAVSDAIDRLRATAPMRILHGDLHMWNAKVFRRRLAAFDFEDLMWGWPVQDLATTLYYFWGDPDFEATRAAFRSGYETVSPWPDSGDDVATFIAGRTLVLANTVLQQPEWRAEASAVLERGERRILDMLETSHRL